MKLVLSLACEDARQRPDGRLDFVGVFDELQAPGFPAAQDRMTVVFIMEWAPEQRGRHEFRADLVDSEQRKVLTIEGHTDVAPEGGRPRTQLLMPLERVIFPHEGEYRFVLTVGDATVPAFSLFVSEAAESGSP
ncbi:MAG: hypothetical protein GWM90_24160 [Gemmatimonadetes bacterium]|nr:hypothetical protein [Gemmatimonadota bacterium]NIQ57832.1 hypothetical protein [Gemmatimonadota bacterium]NIU77985.1 hypothetical protein [Gammaproteobacteria bacterium]NIX47060.1 hypothetical protein [Gemmatimonadota bacterium]NIY11438.1 hypothetical protein [Gemmatimonadota bacterium]